METSEKNMITKPHHVMWGVKRSGPGYYFNTFQPVFQRIPEDTKFLDDKYKEIREKSQKGEISPLKAVSESLKLLWSKDTWNDGITQRVEVLKKEGRDVRVLDLMGYGAVIRKLDVKGLAVAFEDIRTPDEKQYDLVRGVGFVEGNILSSKTWRKIKEDAEKNGKFDLILCRPLAGLSQIPKSGIVYSSFIQRLYNLTNPDRGTILSETHDSMRPAVDSFREKINQIDGISAKNTIGTFSLMRFPNSPGSIPEGVFK